MNVSFLTNNPNLGSTARILRSWLSFCPENQIVPKVIVRSAGTLPEALSKDGVQTRVNPMPFLDVKKPWKSLWQGYRLSQWLGPVSILHCNEHDIYPFSRTLKLFRSFRKVCHVRYKLERGFAEWAFSNDRAPDALLWTSYQQKADSADSVAGLVPEERQHVVRLGIDVERYGQDDVSGREFRRQWQIEDDEVLLGIPAPLRPRKRVHDFIELVARLAPKYPKLVGLIAGGEIEGDEEYRRRIEQMVKDSGLGRRLRWVGNLEPVEPFHHACDVSISTSEYETFGNSVCEAMACEKPVVGYRGGSVAEVVGDAGLIVQTGDLDALTIATEALLENPDRRKEIGVAARKRVENEFSPQASFRQLLKIYDQILTEAVT